MAKPNTRTPTRSGNEVGRTGDESHFERRTCAKLVRFRSGELATVALRATECGRPIACYIREAALGEALHARHTPIKDTLIRELARLANELSALGRDARDLQLPRAAHFERALEALLATIRSIE
jgi:hypothetical protein